MSDLFALRLIVTKFMGNINNYEKCPFTKISFVSWFFEKVLYFSKTQKTSKLGKIESLQLFYCS